MDMKSTVYYDLTVPRFWPVTDLDEVLSLEYSVSLQEHAGNDPSVVVKGLGTALLMALTKVCPCARADFSKTALECLTIEIIHF